MFVLIRVHRRKDGKRTYAIVDGSVVVARTWVSTLGGLRNGVAYEVQVAPRNAAGAGRFTAVSAVPCPAGQAYFPSLAVCVPVSAGALGGLSVISREPSVDLLVSGGLRFSWSYRLPAALGASPVTGFLGQYRESGTTQEWSDMVWRNYSHSHDFWEVTSLDGVNIMTWRQDNLSLPSWKPGVLYDVRVAPQFKDGTHGGFVEATSASCLRGRSYSPSLRKCVSPPSAPGGFTASAGDGAISLAWGPFPSDGGDPPSGFELRWRKLGSTGGWETRTVLWDSATTVMNFGTVLRSWHQTLSGLDNDVRYEIGVSAVNWAGYSPWVQAILASCPEGRTHAIIRAACSTLTDPGKPRNFTLTSGNSTITALWIAPADTGGSRIVSYIVRWNKVGSDGTPAERVVNVPRLHLGFAPLLLRITGLSNTEHYWVEVAARNLARQGDYIRLTSAPCAGAYNSATKKCATKPRSPERLHASSADGELWVSWKPPSDDGGSPITSYKITWKEEGTTSETSATVTASHPEVKVHVIYPRTSSKIYRIWNLRLPSPSTLPALKNKTLYEVKIAATNAAGTGYSESVKSMPCPAGERYQEQYSSCVPTSCPSGKVHSPINGECVPECGRGEEYNETEGGCRPSDEFCEGNPNLSLARDSSGYCEYAWTKTPAGNDITYDLVDCDQPSEFSAAANADTYINTNLPLDGTGTIAQNPMCPPTGLFLALGERRRHQNPTDYYHPEWAIEDDLDKHKGVIARASGDCTVISDAARMYNDTRETLGAFAEWLGIAIKFASKLFFVSAAVELVAEETFHSIGEWKDGVYRLRSGMLAACQAHDYCYDLIRSGLHQTVLKGGRDANEKDGVSGCDEVLRQLWFSYCGKSGSRWRKGVCKGVVAHGFSEVVRLATSTLPEAGIVVLRNSKTGKCLTRRPASAEVVEVVQEHCRFNENHKPNDEDQWFHVLQAAPSTNAATGPTEAGYFYVVPANVNPADQATWKKSESEAAGGRCLYVDSVSRNGVSRDEVREGSCMVGGVRLSSRVFKLVNTSAVDEYGIRSSGGACWQLEAEAGADDAETAADGVYIVSVSSDSGCGGVLQGLQRWRIEPVDPTAASR